MEQKIQSPIKRMNKRGAVTFSTFVISLIMFVFIFIVVFEFVDKTAEDNDYQRLPLNYSSAVSNFTVTHEAVYDDLNEFKNIVNNISEASSIYQVAVNGFRGIGQVFKFPFTMFDYLTSVVEVTFHLTEGIMPVIVKTTLAMILLILISLLVLRLISGGNNAI